MTTDDINRTLNEISYKDWDFKLGKKGSVLYLQVRFQARCTDENSVPKIEVQKGRKWMLSKHMTKSELVQTALKAVLTAEEHEVREQFKYGGEAVFGPHFDVNILHEIACTGTNDVRDPMPSENIDRPENEVIDPDPDVWPTTIKLAQAFVKALRMVDVDARMDEDTDMGPNSFIDTNGPDLSVSVNRTSGIAKMKNESHTQ